LTFGNSSFTIGDGKKMNPTNKNKIILRAADVADYLTPEDAENVASIEAKYNELSPLFSTLSSGKPEDKKKARDELIDEFDHLGNRMQDLIEKEPRIHVYSLETPEFIHGEASRLISKLRNPKTEKTEFIYYTQRAYEMLFNLAFGGLNPKRRYRVVPTPVNIPATNFAVHRIPNIDDLTKNCVMCVMLRAALLPSMIVSKEIQEYSSYSHITPFALFKISRDDTKSEKDMRYILDLDRSYFDLESLHGKDLIFADPMNATGGSLVTICKYLFEKGIEPKSIKFFNVVSAVKGSIGIIRALPMAVIYTLWMDPALNSKAYILPGLGDAGDRLNGLDEEGSPKNIIRLIANYGSNLNSLYRDQIRMIETAVLGNGKRKNSS